MTVEMSAILAQFKKSGLSLYALPWIVVLGSRSAGKTTLITHSALSFSGTFSISAHCVWHLSDKAVFIEVELDIAETEWLALLQFVQKNRPRSPLNGLIFVEPVTPVPEDTAVFRALFSICSDCLGTVIPVDVCVTYLERISGFEVYFKNTAEKIFPSQANNYQLLFSVVYRLTQSQPTIEQILACLSFPDNFRQAEHFLQQWLQELSRPTPYQETPEVKTLYFTAREKFISGTVEHILSSSTVVHRKSRKHQWLSRWKTSLSAITASVIVLLVLLVCSVSYAHTTFKVHEGVRLGEMVSQSNQANQNKALANYLSHHPPSSVAPVLQEILLRRLDDSVMPNYVAQLENHLMLTQEQWALATTDQAEKIRGNYYDQLKLYLMFCHPQYRDPQFYQDDSLMAFYLNHSRQQWAARSDIVELSRQQLAVTPQVTNIYAGLQAWGEKQLGTVSAPDLFGKSLDSSVVISKFFTMRGFALYVMPEVKRLHQRDWVMQASSDNVKDNVLRLYKSTYKKAWIQFLQQLRPSVGEAVTEKTVHKIMATAHQNILFKSTDKNQDPALHLAIQNIMLLPQMTRLMSEMTSAWQSQVDDIYKQKLAGHYPFSYSHDDVDSADFHAFFDMPQGIFWKFLHRYSDSNINFSPEFAHTVLQAKAFSSPMAFEIYPEPTVGLKEIRLVVNHQSYRYRNDPQEWQSMQWRVADNHPESALEIITSSGAEGIIECDSPWGFFRLLQKAELTKQDDEVFRAMWRIRAEDGRIYAVSFLFKNTSPENLFEVMLFGHFVLNKPFGGIQ